MIRFKKFWPEILTAVLLVAYTIVRTLVVAQGISPVSNVSWQVFLGIELITTIPYVWAMGFIIRHSRTRRGAKKRPRTERMGAAIATAIVSLVAPYVYLAIYGSLNTYQGVGLFVGLLLVSTLPSCARLIEKVRRNR